MQDQQPENVPQYLYKIMSPEDWQSSKQNNQIVNSPYDKEFIHLAKEDQVQYVVQKFWNGKSYVILKLNPKKFIGRLMYETNPGGSTKYFHLYDGTIPLDAVIETPKFHRQ